MYLKYNIQRLNERVFATQTNMRRKVVKGRRIEDSVRPSTPFR